MDAREHLRCSDFEELAVLYAAGELNNEERAAVESHADLCSDCAATLEIEMRLRDAIAARPAAADELDRCGFLLAQCRSELAEAIDDSTIADGNSECNKTQEMAAR